jgi:hypothetical protein
MEEVTVMRTFVICKVRIVQVIKGCSFTQPQPWHLSYAPAALPLAKALLVPIEWKVEWAEDLVYY